MGARAIVYNSPYVPTQEAFMRTIPITHTELLEWLSYSPKTGDFTWLKRPAHRIQVGDKAGALQYGRNGPNSRVVIRLKNQAVYAHRLAWFYMTREWPSGQIDHIDGDELNNAWCNLRDVTNQENQKNRRLGTNNKTGLCGVQWDDQHKKFRVQIVLDTKRVHKTFGNLLDAACFAKSVYNKFGFHENHGKRRG